MVDRFAIRNVYLPTGEKRDVGRLGVDLYPKVIPGSFPSNQPWQADFATRWNSMLSDRNDGEGQWVFAAELQAGSPLKIGPWRAPVPACATDQLLFRTIGRGGKGASLFVMRDGLNDDGTRYDFGGPLRIDGSRRPRFDVAKTWGAFLTAHGAELERSTEVVNRIAILVNERLAAPQAGVATNLQQLHTIENPALFGWLANAGLNPELVDARSVTPVELARYAVVMVQNPGIPDDHVDALLRDHPGTVVSFLDASSDLNVTRTNTHRHWLPYVDGKATYALGKHRGSIATFYQSSYFKAAPSSSAIPFLRDISNGKAMGWIQEDGAKKRVVIGTNVYTCFNHAEYYVKSAERLNSVIDLGRELAALGGEVPILSTGKAREVVWARQTDASTFVFCVNDNGKPTTSHVTIHDPSRLGIVPEASYDVYDALHNIPICQVDGRTLARRGFDVELAKYGTAVVRIVRV
ncbi:MAG: hypothetical protein H7Z43_16110 [Clostridia bacterium]|nr:hypothetical protein [Deltaproteobacteria bacterium]